MSTLGRSSVLCLPLHYRMQNIRTRRLSNLICGSFISSHHPRFKNCRRTLLSSKVKHEKQNRIIRCSSSSTESSFWDMISFRQKQAKHSVVIELSSRVDLPCALNLCKAYGDIKNMIAFIGGKSQLQAIAEFEQEESVQKLLSDCSFKSVNEVFPCQSRFLRFDSCGKQGNLSVSSNEITELSFGIQKSSNKKPSSVSEMMVELYETEKLSELSIRSRFLCCFLVQDILKGMFPHCIAFPFGSSSNGFGKDSSDLDMIMRLFPEQFSRNPEIYFKARYVKGNSHALQRHAVHVIGDILHTFIPGVFSVQKIKSARIPIVKYEHHILNLDCDISVNNMSALYMTEILFYCGELDPRIRPLVYTVKKWARKAGITHKDPGSSITNFALTLLVMFFLQSRKVPVLPPLNKLVKLPDPDDYRMRAVEYINRGNLRKKSLLIGQNTESLDILLQEFFRFLAVFPFKEQRISVVGGQSNQREVGGYPIWIDYPMDESKNVSTNVAFENMKNLREAALEALKNMENLRTDLKSTDLMSVLGVPDHAESPERIDVRTFLDVNSQPEEAITHAR